MTYKMYCEESDVTVLCEVVAVDILEAIAVIDGSAKASFEMSFRQENLVANKLTIPHSLGISEVVIALFNQDNLLVHPADLRIVSDRIAEIDLTGYTPLTGDWRVKII